jgi:glyoxylase-like metal-dependent hydrolase (beta-lactamase superfamily II)
MKTIVPDVYQIEGLSTANVYLLVSNGELTLVDGGMPPDADRIVAQIETGGYDPARLASIIVTHAHGDHIGGIPKLVQRFDADVIAHRAEAPYLERTASMPVRGAVKKFGRWVSDLMTRETEGIDMTLRVEEGETLDVLGGLQVIHTPGHTPGSMVLYQPERKLLFCGDLIFNGHPLTGRGGLQFAPKLFSVDPQELERSVQKLADLEISALCGGHGDPILRDPSVKLGALLREARA